MNDDILTIDEVAQYLRVSERTVYDWAQKGEIPSGKIGTAWRFKKTELEKWVNERLAAKSKPRPGEPAVKVKNILSPDRIVFLSYPAKHDALVNLSGILASAPQVKDKRELTEEILKREDLMSTAIGRGIAIPHVRLSSVTDLVIAVGISRTDVVDFKPIDDEPVRLLIMIAAAYNQHSYYLQALSYFSSRLKNQELREALVKTDSAEAAYNLLVKESN